MIRDAVQKENAELRTNRDTLLNEISGVKQKSESDSKTITQEYSRKYEDINNKILVTNQRNEDLKSELDGLKRNLNDNQIVHQRNQDLKLEIENLKRKLVASTPAKVVASTPAKVVPNSRILIESSKKGPPIGLTVLKPVEKPENSKFGLPAQLLPGRLEITRASSVPNVKNPKNDDDEDPDDPDPVDESSPTVGVFTAKVEVVNYPTR